LKKNDVIRLLQLVRNDKQPTTNNQQLITYNKINLRALAPLPAAGRFAAKHKKIPKEHFSIGIRIKIVNDYFITYLKPQK
jgi:hypothetical protein